MLNKVLKDLSLIFVFIFDVLRKTGGGIFTSAPVNLRPNGILDRILRTFAITNISEDETTWADMRWPGSIFSQRL